VRDFVQSLGLKDYNEWRAWSRSDKRPLNIPYAPIEVYAKEGWKGFGDWLGTGRIANRKRVFRSFQNARAFACNIGLKSNEEWEDWVGRPERPKDIPSHPERIYKGKGWVGWTDWLGKKRIAF
jgi:hypothetical protein